MAKPIAGGLPLGALLATEEVARAFHPGMHGTTFGGGPLACAVAIAVVDEVETLLLHVEEVGGYFHTLLSELKEEHSVITDVRGMGLMLAIELESADLAKAVLAAMTARHILINRTSETVLRFLPPYILEKKHVDEAVAALDEILSELRPAQVAAAANKGDKIGD